MKLAHGWKDQSSSARYGVRRAAGTELERARRRYQRANVAVDALRHVLNERIKDAIADNFILKDPQKVLDAYRVKIVEQVRERDKAGDAYDALRRGEDERRLAAAIRLVAPIPLKRVSVAIRKPKRTRSEQITYESIARFVLTRGIHETRVLARLLRCDPRTVTSMRKYAAADERPWNKETDMQKPTEVVVRHEHHHEHHHVVEFKRPESADLIRDDDLAEALARWEEESAA